MVQDKENICGLGDNQVQCAKEGAVKNGHSWGKFRMEESLLHLFLAERQAASIARSKWWTKVPVARSPCSYHHWRLPTLLAMGIMYRVYQTRHACFGVAATRRCLQVVSEQALTKKVMPLKGPHAHPNTCIVH